MADPKIVSEWIAKADEDFEFASINLKGNKTFFPRYVFIFSKPLKNI